jgi:sensor domain CHASE-containing protein
MLTLVANNLLQTQYSTLEQQFLERNLRRVSNEVSKQLAQLERWAVDYGNWSATYDYLQGNYPSYPAEEWTLSVQVNLGVDTVILTDLNRTILHSKSMDDGANIFRETEDYELALVNLDVLYLVRDQISVTGLMLVNDRLALVTAKPVLTTEGEGPSVGTLFLLQYADEELISDLNRSLALDVALFVYDELGPEYIRQAIREYKGGTTNPIAFLSAEVVQGYVILSGIDGEPIALAQVTEERTVSQQGRNTVALFLASIGVAGLVAAVALAVFLDRSVFARLRHLTDQLAHIRNNQDAVSLEVRGNDELTEVATTINDMLARLRDSNIRAEQQRGVADETSREVLRLQELLQLMLNQTEDILRRSGSHAEIRDLVQYTRKELHHDPKP